MSESTPEYKSEYGWLGSRRVVVLYQLALPSDRERTAILHAAVLLDISNGSDVLRTS